MAQYAELDLDQGTDYNIFIDLTNNDGTTINCAGYSFAMTMRKSYYSTTATDFTISITDAAAGQITMTMNSAKTGNVTPGRYVYDVLIKDSANTVTRVLEGIINVNPQVTRF